MNGRELVDLLVEDLRTYERDLTDPCFWAVAVHRVGTWADGLERPRLKRAVRAATGLLSAGLGRVGVALAPEVKLGRRVRLWHHGCVRIAAREIGDDVHIRQSTTVGPLPAGPQEPEHWPVIGDRVDIGSGACILGAVRVGNDAFVSANSAVLADVPPRAAMLGVPARRLPGRR